MDTTRGKRGQYGRYTAEERERAVGRAREIGLKVAATELSIPVSTLGRWVAQANRCSDASQATETGVAGKVEAGTGAVEVGEEAAEVPVSFSRKGKGGAARRYTPSEKAAVLEHVAAHGVSKTAQRFGVSRFAIYAWRRKLDAAVAGEGPSPTGGDDPEAIVRQRDQEILGEWKRHRGLGPSQIRNQLRRNKGIRVSVDTVRRVMEEHGYRPPKVRRHEHDERFESVRPNHMWHLDFVHRNINKASAFTLILIDDHSRFVTGHGVDDAERADLVLETFERAVARYGRPEWVMHDRGSAFWSWRGISRFTRLLEELGIDQIAVRHKEHNGKIEVFNANLAKELFDVHRFYDLGEMKRRLAGHLDWYNHQRTHHALGGLLVPADRFYGRVDEVMARIEAGGGQSPDLHAIDLRDRELELFRVVQRDGVPELWLMGRKVLSLGRLT